ncbi:MAG: hypothetical protein J6P82_04370, partial [Bacteroidales bacterium]|nr:hypothetical protein [Bacteroidales bacterium]
VAFIDVHNISADKLDVIGQEGAKAYYNRDHTHTSLIGGQLNARSVHEGMRALGYYDILVSECDILTK